MERQLDDLDSQIDDYVKKMKYYESVDMIDEYNLLVSPYNTKNRERNGLYERYSRLVDDINADVATYNSMNR